ncbi:MAG: type II toxin-antitoxin system prevent-host-death family antitoxin [Deltaproteobacteria bacterium]|nr:type II toxin-antitoxin system prevent-host-death family antitoxin [Deltaproteobacteria bacterium]
MALQVGAFEAKTQLSKLLELARKGQRVVITKHGVPVAELVPPRELGSAEPQRVIKELKALRGRTKRGKETIKQMISEGRRL